MNANVTQYQVYATGKKFTIVPRDEAWLEMSRHGEMVPVSNWSWGPFDTYAEAKQFIGIRMGVRPLDKSAPD